MSTLVVSDLHLGARSGVALLAREDVRARLLGALDGVQRLVLLGDTLELREGPAGDALARAEPALRALGEGLSDREVVLVPGNHDHVLLERWRADRRRRHQARPLALAPEQRIAPAQASDLAAEVACWLGGAEVVVAYPGLWLTDDVYATHGHYLDRHLTVPTIETLAVRVVERLLGMQGSLLEGVEGYEAVLAPVYALAHELAQAAPAPSSPTPVASASGRAYRVLAGPARGRRPLRHRALSGLAFPAAVRGLNAAGLGPLRTDLTGPELRRAALRAMGQVADDLKLGAAHVIFGHTHRTGPLPGDVTSEWRSRGGTRLYNCGSWAIERFLGGAVPRDSPYRGGGAVRLGAGEAPRVERWLEDISYRPRLPGRA